MSFHCRVCRGLGYAGRTNSFDALKELVGDSLAQELIKQSEGVQKAASQAGIKFKEEGEAVEVEVETPAPAKTIGDMTEADLMALIQKVITEMSAGKETAEAEAQKEAHAKATQVLAEEVVKVKNLQSLAAKRVGELEKQIAELSGEQPRINTQGYRATQDPATIRKEAQPAPVGPQADPNFMKFLTGASAQ